MQLNTFFSTILLGGCVCVLTSCAAWRPDQDSSSVVDGNANYASNVQTSGLGQDGGIGAQGAQDDNLTKRTYYFDFDKSEVHEQDKPAIQANAEYLLNHPNAKTLLEGHTDPRGSREYNIALGERRSKAVAEILKQNGVRDSQIRLISYGAEKLASNGHTEEDYQMDRRGVLVYIQQ